MSKVAVVVLWNLRKLDSPGSRSKCLYKELVIYFFMAIARNWERTRPILLYIVKSTILGISVIFGSFHADGNIDACIIEMILCYTILQNDLRIQVDFIQTFTSNEIRQWLIVFGNICIYLFNFSPVWFA